MIDDPECDVHCDDEDCNKMERMEGDVSEDPQTVEDHGWIYISEPEEKHFCSEVCHKKYELKNLIS